MYICQIGHILVYTLCVEWYVVSVLPSPYHGPPLVALCSPPLLWCWVGDNLAAVEGIPTAVEGILAAVEGIPAAVKGIPAAVEGNLAAVEGTPAAEQDNPAAAEGSRVAG